MTEKEKESDTKQQIEDLTRRVKLLEEAERSKEVNKAVKTAGFNSLKDAVIQRVFNKNPDQLHEALCAIKTRLDSASMEKELIPVNRELFNAFLEEVSTRKPMHCKLIDPPVSNCFFAPREVITYMIETHSRIEQEAEEARKKEFKALEQRVARLSTECLTTVDFTKGTVFKTYDVNAFTGTFEAPSNGLMVVGAYSMCGSMFNVLVNGKPIDNMRGGLFGEFSPEETTGSAHHTVMFYVHAGDKITMSGASHHRGTFYPCKSL